MKVTLGPDQVIAPGGSFESFRAFELAQDSTERERKTLTLRRMYRTVSPWVTENRVLMHVRSARPDAVRQAIDQCAEVGFFEMVVLTFGSGFDFESRKPEYQAQIKELADYGRSKGIALGGYSLLASRGAATAAENTQGVPARYGVMPCLGATWGSNYLTQLRQFMETAPGANLAERELHKEIRLMLSELLRASSRNAEAREQLEKLASDLEARGDTIGARRTLMRLQALDAEPEGGGEAAPKPASKRSNDLVFLDTGVSAGAPQGGKATASPRLSRKTLAHPKLPGMPPAAPGLPLIDVGEAPLAIETSSLASEPLVFESVQPISEEARLEATASGDIAKALGFEATVVEGGEEVESAPVEGLEIDRPTRDSLRLNAVESPLNGWRPRRTRPWAAGW